MRLITTFKNKEEAESFLYILETKQINASITLSKKNDITEYALWVNDEDSIEDALKLYESFQKNEIKPSKPPTPSKPPIQQHSFKESTYTPSSFPFFTYIIFSICLLFYAINNYQAYNYEKTHNIETLITPLQYWCLYDIPVKIVKLNDFIQKHELQKIDGVIEVTETIKTEIEEIERNENIWEGFYYYLFQDKLKNISKASLFIKLRQGQVWRLITPIFLHANFFHILFNMLWLLFLSKQLEERINIYKHLSLIIIIAIISNTCQYLMTGPLFCGYSGVIIGLIGFIWRRQKKTPWEGYPMPKGVILFVSFYLIVLFVVQFISLATPFNIAIANTAHVSGGVTGILLGNTTFFSRSFSK